MIATQNEDDRMMSSTTMKSREPRSATTVVARARSIAAEIAQVHADDVDVRARFPEEAIVALKKERLMSAGIATELGGEGASMIELAAACEALGHHCAATGMIYAMHLIQVACIARHSAGSPFFTAFLTELVEKQSLLASATSEVGIGGEMRASVAGVVHHAKSFAVDKDATTISYGAQAEGLLLTARKSLDAARGDQVLVVLRRADYTLEKKGTWDTLGMRGTCSPAFHVSATANEEQILPVPFATIASETMVPFSHILWSSCWLGIATSAIARARSFVRGQARANPGIVPPAALRLAEASSQLQLMSTNVHEVAAECQRLMDSSAGTETLSSIAFALKMNNLKIATSQLTVDIVQRALSICGISGYKNDTRFAVGRHLRDAHSAALMVANDRIYATNASLLLVLKDD
jgi:acyl-CoA dehydrogenase